MPKFEEPFLIFQEFLIPRVSALLLSVFRKEFDMGVWYDMQDATNI